MAVAPFLRHVARSLGLAVPALLLHPLLVGIAVVLAVEACRQLAPGVRALVTFVWEDSGKGYVSDVTRRWFDRRRARKGMVTREQSPWHREHRGGDG